MKKFHILVYLVLILGCNLSQREIVGHYVLKNPNEEHIAEILELNIDSTFVFSGLENKDNYPMTWIIEGNWKLKENIIWLNSVGHDVKGYGDNINLEYLENFSDSVKHWDQAIIVCQNCYFLIKNEALFKNENGVKLIYEKKEHSR